MPQSLLNVHAVLDALEGVGTVTGMDIKPGVNSLQVFIDYRVAGRSLRASFLSDSDHSTIIKRGKILNITGLGFGDELAIAFKYDFLID